MIYIFDIKEFNITEPELNIKLSETFPNVEEEKKLYPCSALQSLCYYQNGRLHGPSCYFSQSGQLLSETWFWQGKKEGAARFFYQSGSLYAKFLFRNGIKTNTQEYFYETGQLKTSETYKEGLLHGKVLLYWPSGQLKRSSHFIHGKRSDEDQIWNEKGILLVDRTDVIDPFYSDLN